MIRPGRSPLREVVDQIGHLAAGAILAAAAGWAFVSLAHDHAASGSVALVAALASVLVSLAFGVARELGQHADEAGGVLHRALGGPGRRRDLSFWLLGTLVSAIAVVLIAPRAARGQPAPAPQRAVLVRWIPGPGTPADAVWEVRTSGGSWRPLVVAAVIPTEIGDGASSRVAPVWHSVTQAPPGTGPYTIEIRAVLVSAPGAPVYRVEGSPSELRSRPGCDDADGSGDGVVGAPEFGLLVRHFGQRCAPIDAPPWAMAP